jgi:ABC-2 type transport system permease protein
VSDLDIFGSGDAQILDRGFRHYDGPRTGVRGAMAAVIKHSVQRALGLRRTIWAKLLPIAAAAIAYVPAIVFVGIVALVKFDQATPYILPTYGEYYSFVIAALLLFSALVAPEVLCTDRRSGMLGVYFASPLDRDTYLVAKAVAVAAVLGIVCLGPTLLMLIANVLQSQGPSGAGDITLTAVRVIVAGLVITVMHTSITMGVASLTDRKSIAAAGVILLFFVSNMVVGTLSAGGSTGIRVLAPTFLTLELATRVHGETSHALHGASSITVWAAWAAWTAGGFALAWYRLTQLAVTR